MKILYCKHEIVYVVDDYDEKTIYILGSIASDIKELFDNKDSYMGINKFHVALWKRDPKQIVEAVLSLYLYSISIDNKYSYPKFIIHINKEQYRKLIKDMNDIENSALSKWLKCKVHRIQFQLEKEFNIKSGIKEYHISKGGVTIKKNK